MRQRVSGVVLHERCLVLVRKEIGTCDPRRCVVAVDEHIGNRHNLAYTALGTREPFSFFSTFNAALQVKSCNVYLAKITIRLKPSIQDPQGLAVRNALHDLGFKAGSVRMGKFAEVWIDTNDKGQAEREARDMCEKLLVNAVMETYEVVLEEKK